MSIETGIGGVSMKLTKPPSHWYELDWLLPYKDLVLIAGGTLVVAGVAMLTIAGAFIVAGSTLAFLAWRMAAR